MRAMKIPDRVQTARQLGHDRVRGLPESFRPKELHRVELLATKTRKACWQNFLMSAADQHRSFAAVGVAAAVDPVAVREMAGRLAG